MANEKQEEQLTDPLDALLTAEEAAPAPAPETETPAPETPGEPETPVAEEQPAEEPQTPEPEAEAPAVPVEPEQKVAEPETKKVPLGTYVRARRKTQELQRQLAEKDAEIERLRQTQVKEVDPLEAWEADPEHEGLKPDRELLKKHDDFVRNQALRDAQKSQVSPQSVTQAQVAHADSVLATSPQVLDALKDALKRELIDKSDLAEIASSENPLLTACEIVRTAYEADGSFVSQAILAQLFPPQVTAKPKPAAQPQKPVAPALKAQPKPKPQEETPNEDAYQPFEQKSHAARVMEHMFPGKR